MAFSVRTVMVTGASRGIGLELIKQIVALPSAPEVVIAACRDPSSATGLQDFAKANPSVKVVKLDVEKDDDIDKVVKETQGFVGENGLNLLINNAGLNEKSDGGGIYKCTRDRMQRHFGVNVSSPLVVAQKFLPLLQAAAAQKPSKQLNCQAGIIMISSIMGSSELTYQQGFGTSLHYKCSKAAVTMANVLLSRELQGEGIFVSAVHPGWVKTDMGGSNADLTVEESVSSVLKVIGDSSQKTTGKLLNYDGKVLPY